MICRTREEHKRDKIQIVPIKNLTVSVGISNIWENEVLPVNGTIGSYVEFLNGFAVVEKSSEKIKFGYLNPKVKSSQSPDFGLEPGQLSPFYRGYQQYAYLNRTNDLFQCFFLRKYCLIVNDTDRKWTKDQIPH